MKLLITNIPESSIWEYVDGFVSPMYFENYDDHELCVSNSKFIMNLPLEILTLVFSELVEIYIKTRNFDLLCDLLFVSKFFTDTIYNSWFGKSNLPITTKISRLLNTFLICEHIHDYYITRKMKYLYSGIALITNKDSNDDFFIWDFYNGFRIQELTGLIYDDSVNIHGLTVGSMYGNQVWLSGSFQDLFFECDEIQTPILNITLLDQYGTLLSTEENLRDNHSFKVFCKILRKAYGPRTGINFMIKEDDELDNVFISTSTLFYSF